MMSYRASRRVAATVFATRWHFAELIRARVSMLRYYRQVPAKRKRRKRGRRGKRKERGNKKQEGEKERKRERKINGLVGKRLRLNFQETSLLIGRREKKEKSREPY